MRLAFIAGFFVVLTACGSSDQDEKPTCLGVMPFMATGIAMAQEEGVDMTAGEAVAVRSPNLADIYFVAMEFTVDRGDEYQVGVWVATKSLIFGDQGAILAVDGVAQEFTSWDDADTSPIQISEYDKSIDAAKECLKRD